jgi:Holliday junction resolvase RusA-like endonuclease
MRVVFTVLGSPQGKGRPRFARVGNYVRTHTPDATVLYENLVITEFRRQCGDSRFPKGEYIELSVVAYYPIPASASKKKREQMMSGELRPIVKPDWDNVGKVVADSLNGIAYHDDAHVVDGHVYKYYSDRPRIEVALQTVKPKIRKEIDNEQHSRIS